MEFRKTKRGTLYYRQDVASMHNGVFYPTSVYVLARQLPQVQAYNNTLFKYGFFDRMFDWIYYYAWVIKDRLFTPKVYPEMHQLPPPPPVSPKDYA